MSVLVLAHYLFLVFLATTFAAFIWAGFRTDKR